MMAMIFATVVPLISIFACLFFTFKYFVDKYNLTFVYQKEFEGGGAIKKKVIPYTLFSTYVFQILNLGYFALKFDKRYLIAGGTILILQSVLLCFARGYYIKKRRDKKK
jgi:hypothetical protein